MLTQYTWAAVIGGILCFTLGGGMGANDVANNFGTSVGSRSISLKNALFIAAVFELLGSIGLGASVTDSVRNGVYDVNKMMDVVGVNRAPEFLLIANLTVLLTVTIWLFTASYIRMSVSTTHSIIGAYLGCGLALSPKVVHWKYLWQILASWIFAPVLASVTAALFFVCVRHFILRAPDAIARANRCLPALVLYVCGIISFFFTFANPLTLSSTSCKQKLSDGTIANQKPCIVSHWMAYNRWIAVAIAAGSTVLLSLVLYFPIRHWIHRSMKHGDSLSIDGQPFNMFASRHKHLPGWYKVKRQNKRPRRSSTASSFISELRATNGGSDMLRRGSSEMFGAEEGAPRRAQTHEAFGEQESHASSEDNASVVSMPPNGVYQPIDPIIPVDDGMAPQISCTGRLMENAPWNRDIHMEASIGRVAEMEQVSEKFNKQAESYFKALQTCSAALACLVHGSNDVGNAAAPFASIYSIYRHGVYLHSVPVPLWVLCLGGLSISLGLMLLGYKVIRTVGVELVHMNAPKGFCVEMALFSVIITASFLGITISSTHIGVGAMIGVGLMDRHFAGETDITRKHCGLLNLAAVNWPLAGKLAVSWIGTLVLCGTAAYALLGFAVHTPSLNPTPP